MPEHELLSTDPGQPPLSRWIAQMDSRPSEWSRAKLRIRLASEQLSHLGLALVVIDAGQERDPLHRPQFQPDFFGYRAASWRCTLFAASVAAVPMSTRARQVVIVEGHDVDQVHRSADLDRVLQDREDVRLKTRRLYRQRVLDLQRVTVTGRPCLQSSRSPCSAARYPPCCSAH